MTRARDLAAFVSNADGDIKFDTDTLFVDSSTNRVGIGTATPEANLLHLVDSDVVAPNADADDLVIEKTGDTGLSILSTSTGRIYFGDAANDDAGSIRYVHSDNSMRFETDDVERMRIDSDGHVLVGHTSADVDTLVDNNTVGITLKANGEILASSTATVCTLERENSDGDILEFRKDGATIGSIGIVGGGLTIDGESGHTGLRFANDSVLPRDNGADTNEADDLGATNNKWRNLYSIGVYTGSVSTSGASTGVSVDANRIKSSSPSTGFVYHARFYNPNGQVGYIATQNSGTVYITSSDYRLKENVADISDGITRVKQLAPKRFNFISDGADVVVDGFLAHEAQTVVPEAVTGTKDAMMDEEYEVKAAVTDDDGAIIEEAEMGTRSVPDYQGIDQSKIVPLLTAALQEAIAKIETLETQNTTQATQIADLITRVEALEAE